MLGVSAILDFIWLFRTEQNFFIKGVSILILILKVPALSRSHSIIHISRTFYRSLHFSLLSTEQARLGFPEARRVRYVFCSNSCSDSHTSCFSQYGPCLVASPAARIRAHIRLSVTIILSLVDPHLLSIASQHPRRRRLLLNLQLPPMPINHYSLKNLLDLSVFHTLFQLQLQMAYEILARKAIRAQGIGE